MFSFVVLFSIKNRTKEFLPFMKSIIQNQNKIMIVFTGTLVALVLLGSLLYLSGLKERTLEKARKNLLSTSHLLQVGLEAYEDRSLAIARQWAETDIVKESYEVLSKTPRDQLVDSPQQKKLRLVLRRLIKNYHLRGYFLMTAQGLSLASSRDSNIGSRNLIHSDAQFVSKIFAGIPSFSKLVPSDVPLGTRSNSSFFAGAPIRDDNGKVLGAFFIRLEPERLFDKIMKNGYFGDTGLSYGVNSESQLITSLKDEDSLKRANLLRSSQKNQVLNIAIRVPNRNLIEEPLKPTEDVTEFPPTKIVSEVQALGLKPHKGRRTQLLQLNAPYKNFLGIEVLGVAYWDDVLNVGVVSEIHLAEVLEDYYYSARIVYAAAFVLIVLMVLFSFISTNFFKILHKKVNARTAELIEAKAEAEKVAEIKGRFLANMSHEIRTPINGILGMANILVDSGLNSQQKDMVDTVVNSGRMLTTVLNDILDFSTLETGKMAINANVIDIDEFSVELVQLYRFTAEEKGLRLRLELEKDLPSNFVGDPSRIGQVLGNFISNAIKFTEEGEVVLHIGVSRYKDPERPLLLIFRVIDTGIGISQEDQEKVFEEFYQVHEEGTRRYNGAGLGLNICKDLSELMGGDIFLSSKQGEGTQISLRLPTYSVEEYRDNDGNFVDGNFTNHRALVVEDNVVNQTVIRMLLEKKGMKVDLVSSGEEALMYFANPSYRKDVSIILMDLKMPGISGIETTKSLIQKHGALLPPIVALTANVLPEHKEQCLKAGMVDFLEKPINKSQLLLVLHRLLKKAS